MKIISEASKNVTAILGKVKISDNGYRLIKYCVAVQVDEGILLFNTLTRELLLLTSTEYDNLQKSEELRDRWFTVPESLNEKELATTVRWVLSNTAKKPDKITSYTIMTTTDCNARCFYCFEKGRARTPMTDEVAHKTAVYIKEHCGGECVKLAWFGGEPLFNAKAIDIICEDLRRDGIEFYSEMTSNGYLFNDETVKKANALWNLKRVQITLDGTEEIYNRSKSYIYTDGKSPYRVVLDNIESLLNSEIRVVIRLNLDLYNADDLMRLVDELSERFNGKKGLKIYAYHLFDTERSMAETHTDEEWEPRYEALYRLESKIDSYGLSNVGGIRKKLKINHCMADSGNSRIIAPTGDVGLCEHYTESEFIGHIDRDSIDETALASWIEKSPEIPECNDCALYPECIKLKKCTSNSACFKHSRQSSLKYLERAILHEYYRWKHNVRQDEGEEDIQC